MKTVIEGVSFFWLCFAPVFGNAQNEFELWREDSNACAWKRIAVADFVLNQLPVLATRQQILEQLGTPNWVPRDSTNRTLYYVIRAVCGNDRVHPLVSVSIKFDGDHYREYGIMDH